jgi:hypothetical protein
MDRTYNVGADNSSIGFEVRVGSAATCFTGAYQFLAGGQKVLKGESLKADNGAIKTKPLGNGSDLKNSKLSVQTIADLSALPADVIAAIKSDPHALKVNLKIEYFFNGGTAGQQIFDYDYDDYMISSNGKIAVVTKHILLVP